MFAPTIVSLSVFLLLYTIFTTPRRDCTDDSGENSVAWRVSRRIHRSREIPFVLTVGSMVHQKPQYGDEVFVFAPFTVSFVLSSLVCATFIGWRSGSAKKWNNDKLAEKVLR